MPFNPFVISPEKSQMQKTIPLKREISQNVLALVVKCQK